MLFVCTFDVIFEVEAVVGELPDHLIHPPCHIPTDGGDEGHGLTDVEFMRRHWGFIFGQPRRATLSLLGLSLLLLLERWLSFFNPLITISQPQPRLRHMRECEPRIPVAESGRHLEAPLCA